MKNIVKILSLSLLAGLLASCATISNSQESNSSSSSSEQNSSSQELSSSSEANSSSSEKDSSSEEISNPLNEFNLASNPQDGTILHAWSWSIKEITKAIPEIAKAGFSSVQTSPMQPQKDFYPNDHYKSWWKVYQPLGFKVATENNAIGTKNDLTELCKVADQYGVKIIVDVVANHLAGGGSESFHRDVNKYEPEIYSKKLYHTGIGTNSDSDPKKVVQGTIGGFPDLKTEDPIVQNAVLDLLKEYIDCGVDGFRFDAAKHIEVPEDVDTVASEFWNVTLNGAKEYALSKKQDNPYYYGEILHTVGVNRSYLNYTKRMSVTDSNASSDLLSAVTTKNFVDVSDANIYTPDIAPAKAVLWGESHDTFANNSGASKNVTNSDANKAYALAASRNKATSLYFIRPDNSMRLGTKSTNVDWMSKEISEINKFHNTFINSHESFANDTKDIYAAYKSTKNLVGALIVNQSKTSTITLDTMSQLGDGTYVDHISNNEFKVEKGILKGKMSDNGIACLYQKGSVEPPKPQIKPSIKFSVDENEILTGETPVEIKVSNATEAYYQINNGKKVNFSNNVIVKLGSSNFEGKISLKVVAKNGTLESAKTITYTFKNGDVLNPLCSKLPTEIINGKDVGVWVWNANKSNSSRWIKGKFVGENYTFQVTENDTHFILVTFEKGKTFDWSNKIKQTSDIPLGKAFYEVSESFWL